MRMCVPDFCTSNHDGKFFPPLSIVMSHRPMTAGSAAFFNKAADALIAEKRNNDKMICTRIKRKIPLWFKTGGFFIFSKLQTNIQYLISQDNIRYFN